MPKPKDSAPGASRGAPDQQAPNTDAGAQSGAASVPDAGDISSAAPDISPPAPSDEAPPEAPLIVEVPEGHMRVRAIDGATAMSINGREYAVDAEGFVMIETADYDALRAVGALA